MIAEMPCINLNQWLRNGWTIKHPDDVQTVDSLTMVKQCVDNIIVIYDGEDFLNA